MIVLSKHLFKCKKDSANKDDYDVLKNFFLGYCQSDS